jgi:hypothetical protein
MNSDFENQLRRQLMRTIPPHWRARIVTPPPPVRWREWFLPSPHAWATLGAVWVVIFVFHFTTPDQPRLVDNSYPPQSLDILQEQTMMMAQLLGPIDGDEQPTALSAPQKPRSERAREELVG